MKIWDIKLYNKNELSIKKCSNFLFDFLKKEPPSDEGGGTAQP